MGMIDIRGGFEKAQEFIERSQKIKEGYLNLLNAEMCQVMGWEYRPPRWFTNPLGAAEGMEKGTAIKVSSEAKTSAVAVETA